MRIGRFSIPALTLFLLAAPVSAEVYRWVDENGVTHYGDHVPAKYAGQEKAVLNDHGVPIGVIAGRKTPEQLAAAQRLQEAEENKRKSRERDRVLLYTYLSVEEIEMLRDRRLELLLVQTQVTEAFILQLEEKLGRLQREAKKFNYPPKPDSERPPLPENLSADIDLTAAAIIDYEHQLLQRRTVYANIKNKFDDDIERFGELKGLKTTQRLPE